MRREMMRNFFILSFESMANVVNMAFEIFMSVGFQNKSHGGIRSGRIFLVVVDEGQRKA